MKLLFRLFFRGVRQVLGPFMLLWERVTRPTPIVRSPEAQARIDSLTRGLSLYHYRTCPFCIRVRRELTRQALNIELRDTQHDPQHREALLAGGGRLMVPCLRIDTADGGTTWLYESAAIIDYLRRLDA